MNFGRRKRRDDVNLELTPLIDVMFLLLIFLLVTATFTQDRTSALPMDLPTGQSGEQLTEDAKITLIVHEDELVSLALPEGETTERLSRDELRTRLEALPAEWRNVPIHLRGDRSARYGKVTEVLDLSRELGFRRVFNVIQRENRE